MLTYLRTPAQQVRNLEDRLGRIATRSSSSKGRRSAESRAEEARSRREPDRAEERSAVDFILNAGPREVDVGPEAERAAEFIHAAEEPDEDADEAVELIKEAGRKRDTREEEQEEEESE